MVVVVVVMSAHAAQDSRKIRAMSRRQTLLAFGHGEWGRAHRDRGGSGHFGAGCRFGFRPAMRAPPTAPMRSMPPTSPRSAPARSRAGCQAATNTDFTAVANPSCAVNVFRPVELSMQTVRSRSDGDWSTTPRAQGQDGTSFRPESGRFGLSFYAGGSFDALTGDNLTAFAVVPVTYRLSETMRINLNGGWMWDRMADRHYLVYGAGFDWKLTDTLQWTIEAFGQAGQSDEPERDPAAVSDRHSLPAERDILGRPDLRPQHHRAKTPTGSRSAPRSAFRCRAANPTTSVPAICELHAAGCSRAGGAGMQTARGPTAHLCAKVSK